MKIPFRSKVFLTFLFGISGSKDALNGNTHESFLKLIFISGVLVKLGNSSGAAHV